MNKILKGVGLAVGAAAAAVLPMFAFASTINTGDLAVPTSTVHDLLASVSNVFTDPGVLGLVVIAAALPIVFWFARQAIGLLPKSRSRTQ